jgi:hypothetical protein
MSMGLRRLIWLLVVFGKLLATQVRLSHGERRRFLKGPPLPTFDLRVR